MHVKHNARSKCIQYVHKITFINSEFKFTVITSNVGTKNALQYILQHLPVS